MNCIYIIINYTKKSASFYSKLLVLLLILGSSCSKDVLDKLPTNSFSDEAVWNDGNLIQAFVDNTYRGVPTSRSTGSYTSTALILGEVTDELYGRGGDIII